MNNLISYFPFSDLKCTRYEFSKLLLFFGIYTNRKCFTPMLILARVTDWWGYCQVTSHVVVDLVNGWPMARTHRRWDRRRWCRCSTAPEDIQVGCFEPGQWFKPLSDIAPLEWLPEQLRWARLRWRTTVIFEITPRIKIGCKKGLRRFIGSPDG
jgi:hypothetical protein